MYVVTVDFEIVPEHAKAFLTEMVSNADVSRAREPGCRQFDVCTQPGKPASVFLYEVYDDRAAFEAHLQSPHFKSFDGVTAPWVVAKAVRTFERVHP